MNRSASNVSRLKGFIGSRGVSTHGLSVYEMIGIAAKLFKLTPAPLDEMVSSIDALGPAKRRSRSKKNRKKMPKSIFSSLGARKPSGVVDRDEPAEPETSDAAMTREWREIVG